MTTDRRIVDRFLERDPTAIEYVRRWIVLDCGHCQHHLGEKEWAYCRRCGALSLSLERAGGS